jgi:hypothetical protein
MLNFLKKSPFLIQKGGFEKVVRKVQYFELLFQFLLYQYHSLSLNKASSFYPVEVYSACQV